MRRADVLGLLAVLALGVLAALLATRVAERYQAGGALVAELSQEPLTRLLPETRECLARLPARVTATYYVSSRAAMPSHMRRIEDRVTDLLAALHGAAPERFDYRIVDPAERPDLAVFAAGRRIAPFRQRSVDRDSYSERTVYSALALSLGTRPQAVIDGITPEQLPRLQRAIVAHLRRLRDPRPPVLALAAPPGFGELADALAERGELLRPDLDAGEPIPMEADLLFWMAPRVVGPERLRELDRYLAAGRSVVVAGSELSLDGGLRAGPDGPALLVRPSGFPAGALWTHLGLRPLEGLFCDERADEVVFEGEPRTAPFAIRCIAPQQDFQRWGTQPNGTLLFALSTPLGLDGAVLARRGVEAHVLATTSDATWRLPPPLELPLPLAEMTRERGRDVPRQALAVELAPDDPWQGSVVALAATTPFEDGVFSRSFDAHAALLRTLLARLASDERLVVNDSPLTPPEPLPALGAAARAGWRFFGVFLLPLVLLALWLLRRRREGPARRAPEGRAAGRPAAAPSAPRLAAAAVCLLALAGLSRRAGLRADVADGAPNTLAAGTRQIAARAGELGSVAVTLAFSPRAALPPSWRPGRERLDERLRDLEQAGARLEVRRLDPGTLGPDGREALAARGVEPTEVTTRDEEVTTVRRVYATVLLERGARSTSFSFEHERGFEELEFRLAFALRRLETGRTPHVAFASDVPRLSAAEAHERFQQKGLFAPSGVDVYSEARALLARSGYRVTHVNPRDPELPDDVDALVWMQPRRSIEAMLDVLARHLHGGGRALLAAQHFNVQSRQYRGAGFDLVYWPQPQSPDVERLWFPELGIELVRDLVFDELSTRIRTDTQVAGRSAALEFERQTSALPFLVRASAANFAADSPVTAHLGDQAFPWPSRLRWDGARLAELGLEARTLITTSPRTWTFDWKGGWIPPEVLAGPPRDEDGEPLWSGRLPLLARFDGLFPRPEAPLGEQRSEAAAPWPPARPGTLFFLGASEPFKDERIDVREFRADHLLESLVATLALDPELASVAVRRHVPRGFGYVPPGTRLAWRATVVAAGPLAVLCAAALWSALRRRRPGLPRRPADAAEGRP